ncbi:MAG TPA: hypothetical protein G4O00_08085 [Thermoflexia bacterium]|jgi:hypothetical protein|nr:hypothetical protein [Thermoflexia bacterium]
MLRKLLALILLGDGLITVVWGPGFLRWQRELAPRWYHPVLDGLLRWPSPLLRMGAAFEALVGWWLLTR